MLTDEKDDRGSTLSLVLSPPAFAILAAAGGFEQGIGLRPALVNIIAGLTMVMVGVHAVVPPDEWVKYVALVTRNLDRAQGIITSDDPAQAFHALCEQLQMEQEHDVSGSVN